MKSVFYFIEKALFILEILKLCNFFASFSHFSDKKRQMEMELFMMSCIDFHKFANVIFGITKQSLYNITSPNLVR